MDIKVTKEAVIEAGRPIWLYRLFIDGREIGTFH
jgi:hypothetical protein